MVSRKPLYTKRDLGFVLKAQFIIAWGSSPQEKDKPHEFALKERLNNKVVELVEISQKSVNLIILRCSFRA